MTRTLPFEISARVVSDQRVLLAGLVKSVISSNRLVLPYSSYTCFLKKDVLDYRPTKLSSIMMMCSVLIFYAIF
jgi:hypothetical protein